MCELMYLLGGVNGDDDDGDVWDWLRPADQAAPCDVICVVHVNDRTSCPPTAH